MKSLRKLSPDVTEIGKLELRLGVEGSWVTKLVFPSLPVFNYPVLVPLLDPISHGQNRMVQIITIAVFIIIHT